MSRVGSPSLHRGRSKIPLSPAPPPSVEPPPPKREYHVSDAQKAYHFRKGHPYHPKKKVVKVETASFRDDLMWVYRQIGGKAVLKKQIVEGDKALLKDILKLLLSLYAKELDVEAKKEAAKGAGSGKNFILVMDGLSKSRESIPSQLLSLFTDPDSIDSIPEPEGDA